MAKKGFSGGASIENSLLNDDLINKIGVNLDPSFPLYILLIVLDELFSLKTNQLNPWCEELGSPLTHDLHPLIESD